MAEYIPEQVFVPHVSRHPLHVWLVASACDTATYLYSLHVLNQVKHFTLGPPPRAPIWGQQEIVGRTSLAILTWGNDNFNVLFYNWATLGPRINSYIYWLLVCKISHTQAETKNSKIFSPRLQAWTQPSDMVHLLGITLSK